MLTVEDKRLRAVWPLVTLRRTPEINEALEKVATDAVNSIVQKDSSTEKSPATPTQRRSMRQAAKLTPPAAASSGVEDTAKSESESEDSKSSGSDRALVQVRTCTFCEKRISMTSKSRCATIRTRTLAKK